MSSKIKEFIKNKKIVIIIVIIVLLLLAGGACFISQLCVSNGSKTYSQTIENTETSTTDSKNIESSEESKEDATDESSSDGASSEAAVSSESSSQTAASSSELSSISSSHVSTPSGSGYGGSQTVKPSQPAQPSHIHSWKDHIAQRWVSNIVTVVDEPEQTVKCSLYRMYWYTTGTWEETQDPARFDTWYKSKDGGLYPLYNPYEKPEDNPLFKGYDDNGNPTYTGDHAIITYYETKPAVTHEEDRGYYESYVDYQYCDCGATK